MLILPSVIAYADNDDDNAIPEIIKDYKKKYPKFKLYPFDENELEWSEFNEKNGSSLITNNTLVIKNDGSSTPIYSYTELPINVNNDFCIYTKISVPKFDEETNYNFIINMDDKKNMGIISVNSSNVSYRLIKNGDNVYEQNTTINGKKGKNQFLMLVVEKKGGKVLISVNGDQCLKLRKIDYKYTGFGYAAYENQKIIVTEIACGNGYSND